MIETSGNRAEEDAFPSSWKVVMDIFPVARLFRHKHTRPPMMSRPRKATPPNAAPTKDPVVILEESEECVACKVTAKVGWVALSSTAADPEVPPSDVCVVLTADVVEPDVEAPDVEEEVPVVTGVLLWDELCADVATNTEVLVSGLGEGVCVVLVSVVDGSLAVIWREMNQYHAFVFRLVITSVCGPLNKLGPES